MTFSGDQIESDAAQMDKSGKFCPVCDVKVIFIYH